jgi:hypothetical protein
MILTLRIVLQYMDVKICINDEDVQLALKRQEFSRHDLHLRARLSEQRKLIRLLLRICQ